MKKSGNKKRNVIVAIIVAGLIFIVLAGEPIIEQIYYRIAVASIKEPEDFPDTLPLNDTLTREQAKEDIEEVFSTISEKHMIKKKDHKAFQKFKDLYQDTLSQLFDGITVQEEWILASKLEHSLRDAHSCVRINIKEKENYHYIGLRFQVEDDGTIWYIEDEQKYRLLSINGLSAEDIYNNAAERLSYENIYWLCAVLEKQLSNAEDMQLLDIPYQKKGITVKYDADGQTIEKIVSYKPYDEGEMNPQEPYNAQYDDSMSLAVFTMNKMEDTTAYRSYVEEFFKEVEERNIQNMVIDLRNNMGGNSTCGEPFVEFLEEEFRGDAYVLTSHRTFSSAELFTLMLYQNRLALVVGEETGGSPNSYGEVRYYSMPNSRLLYRVTQSYFSSSDFAESEKDDRAREMDTIHPDIRVSEEQALEKVKELIK